VVKGIVLYIIITGGLCNYCMGQYVSLFQSVTTRDRLPSNYVFDISEDEHGFFWAGTDKGLAKYDGFKWRIYNMDNQLPGNYIKKVICNGKDAIWLGIATKGLYHYQISTGKITFVSNDILDYQYRLNKAGDLFFFDNLSPDNKTAKFVTAADPAKVQTIFSYNNTLAGYSISVDFEKQQIELIRNINAGRNEKPFLQNYLHWKVDTASFTITYSDILRKENEFLYSNTNTIYIVKSPYELKPVPVFNVHNAYLSVSANDTGYWIWDEKSGLYAMDKEGVIIKHYTEKDGLNNLMVTDVLKAKNGSYLISTLGGGLLCKLPEGSAAISASDKPVRGLSQQGNTVYAAVENKLIKFDITDPGNLYSFAFTDRNIQGVDVWGNSIFITSLYGFSVYAVTGSSLVKKDEKKIGAGISTVIRVKNNFYAGSFGNGVWAYDSAKRTVMDDTITLRVAEKLQLLSAGYAVYNYEDGLQLIDGGSKINVTTKEGLPSNAIYNVHEYKDTIWISTAMGVCAYTKGKVVRTYSGAEGIKGSRCIFSFHDNNGKFWVLTDKHLNEQVGNRFNALVSVAVADGIDDAPYSSLYSPGTNTLVIGTSKKIISIQLDNIKRTAIPTQPVIAAVYYDGKQVAESRLFTLPDDYKTVSFSFKPVDANPFVKSFIYYKLEGLDDRYIELKDSLTVSFPKLRAGRYRLMAKTINADGVESGELLLADFSVDVPYWQKGWFIGLSIVAAALSLFAFYFYFRKRKERKTAAARLLEETLGKERERISKDLHDHLGTSLVTMIAQADNIENKLLNNQVPDALGKVRQLSDQSREIVNVLRETIWAVQENSHSLEEFVLRTRSFLQRVLPQKNIEWDVKVNGEARHIITANQSLQLFRIIQEATQNIVKHAGATAASFIFSPCEKQLMITISDNGKGFDNTKQKNGNGLKNMEERMTAINGSFKIESQQGTTITLEIPVAP
jgi:signal transduction histidine kinase